MTYENHTIADILVNDMIRKIPGSTLSEKLAYCASCECCERHTINRPTRLEPWVSPAPRPQDDDFRCNCICRHAARFICRQCTNLEDTSTIIENKNMRDTGVTEDNI
jgi:hypothetical protein